MKLRSYLRTRGLLAVTGLSLALSPVPAFAGPFILAGTDADDHGSFSLGANQDGWFFMQRALENLGAGVSNGNKKVVILGSTSSAASAATSAFNNSSLVGAGWSLQTVTVANFATYFGVGGGLSSAGILMMDSGANVAGGVSGSSFTPYAAAINTFVGGGGGLFSQANGYQWLSALVPGLTVVNNQSTGLALTPTGTTAFPGLNNGDLSAGPWHNYFTNYGALPVLANSTALIGGQTQAVILGASGGSVTAPTVPDGGSLVLIYAGLATLAFVFRRKMVR
ncbi:MAG: hypothetical protein HZC55_21320 [Verrucomicrobia bacterium]|nr:hypothetical protein [Verrucomicrobiota bacterium]